MTDNFRMAKTPRGYERNEAVQTRFDAAAKRLLEADGVSLPGQAPSLVADLVLEGGGVKGIGLVGAILVLEEAGYTFRAAAGTSAGAIVASLVAAISKSARPITDLREYVQSLDFMKFMPDGKIHQFFDHVVGKKIGDAISEVAILSHREGLYSGDYLKDWLRPILSDLGVEKFGDLRLDPSEDPDSSVTPGREFRVVVHTSDVSRGLLVHLPWDYPQYGYNPDDMDVVDAVRASMSIPFFFEPVKMQSREATVTFPQTGGGTTDVHFAAGTHTWVDGGMLANFPMHAFDRADGKAPRWPTIGIKLSRYQSEYPATTACSNAFEVALHCLKTMTNEWDSYSMDEATAQRTIFVDHGSINATDFDLTKDQQNMLFLNGVRAATEFVIRVGENDGVPLR